MLRANGIDVGTPGEAEQVLRLNAVLMFAGSMVLMMSLRPVAPMSVGIGVPMYGRPMSVAVLGR